jgi:predicted RNase H-like HicB family nuclease
MLTQYITAAMGHAAIEYLSDDGLYYGEIPALPGVWATGPTPEACRATLREVLEDWLLIGLRHNATIPPIDGFDLAVHGVA